MQEIIHRLMIKDKLNVVKQTQNLYGSRHKVELIMTDILSLICDDKLIQSGIKMYEICAEMYIYYDTQIVYDIEIIVEMIMRLRAKRLNAY